MQHLTNFKKSGDSEPSGSSAPYIASLTDELAKLARREGLKTLGFLLDMARLEADRNSKH
jgi:hypothetical protein